MTFIFITNSLNLCISNSPMQDLEHRKVACRQIAIEFCKINLSLRSRLYCKERRPSIVLYANNVNSREQQKNALFQEQIFLSGCFEWGIIYSICSWPLALLLITPGPIRMVGLFRIYSSTIFAACSTSSEHGRLA
jgi:hypothetical protein